MSQWDNPQSSLERPGSLTKQIFPALYGLMRDEESRTLRIGSLPNRHGASLYGRNARTGRVLLTNEAAKHV